MHHAPGPLQLAIISCSLDLESKSRILAGKATRLLQSSGHDPRFVDLRDYPLPAFDNSGSYSDPNYIMLHRVISESDGVILASPITIGRSAAQPRTWSKLPARPASTGERQRGLTRS